MLDPNFIYLSIFLILLGDAHYLLGTIRGGVKPNRVSWFLWGLAPLIIYFAQISKGVGSEALLTLIIGAGPVAIFAATFFNKKSIWKLTKFDLACGALSTIGLIAWYLTKDGALAIILTIIADFFATIPTIKKSYTNPETENYIVYLLNAIAMIIALLTLKTWGFENYGFLIYVLAACLLFVILIKLKPQKRWS